MQCLFYYSLYFSEFYFTLKTGEKTHGAKNAVAETAVHSSRASTSSTEAMGSTGGVHWRGSRPHAAVIQTAQSASAGSQINWTLKS